MANPEHLRRLRQGVSAWNRWREEDLTQPDLSGAYLRGANLRGAYLAETWFSEANLTDADLSHLNLSAAYLHNATMERANLSHSLLFDASFLEARLAGADFRHSHLSGASMIDAQANEANFEESSLVGAYFTRANLRGANLRAADLSGATLIRADLTGASLRTATLERAQMLGAILDGADLTGCRVYGAAAWEVSLVGARQSNLVITPANQPTITVDNLEVAQFIYLLLNNEKIRYVIDTITSKVVLILGRFTPERKAVLDAMRDALRKSNYLPVLFDFDRPASRDTHETITTLARLARFVIADITDPKSIPQELVSVVEQLPSLPIQPLLQTGCEPWGMFDHIKRYPWVLELHRYHQLDDLLEALPAKVIAPAEAKAKQLAER